MSRKRFYPENEDLYLQTKEIGAPITQDLFVRINTEKAKWCFAKIKAKKAKKEEERTGLDGLTCDDFEKDLDLNISNLINKIHGGSLDIPKKKRSYLKNTNGKVKSYQISEKPIAVLEKLVAEDLAAIAEAILLKSNYGGRRGSESSAIITRVNKYSRRIENGSIARLDISNHFESINSDHVTKALDRIIDNSKANQKYKELVLRLAFPSHDEGLARGSSLSPILANLVSHFEIDLAFHDVRAEIYQKCAELSFKEAYFEMLRSADDMVIISNHPQGADHIQKQFIYKLLEADFVINSEKFACEPFGYAIKQKEVSCV